MRGFCILTVFALTCLSSAVEVSWVLPAGGHETSTAEAWDGSFFIEVGAFTAGFTPELANRGNWAAHWVALGRRRYAADDAVILSSMLSENASPFEAGRSVYVWGFRVDSPAREWVLLEDPGWTWPDANAVAGVSWTLTSQSRAIMGAVSGQTLRAAPGGLDDDPVTTPSEWRALRFSAPALLNNPLISGWNADPDADGLTNLLEMAYGTHPLLVNGRQDGAPIGRSVDVAGEVFAEVRFVKQPRMLLEYTFISSDTSITVLRENLNEVVGLAEEPLGNEHTQFISLEVRLGN